MSESARTRALAIVAALAIGASGGSIALSAVQARAEGPAEESGRSHAADQFPIGKVYLGLSPPDSPAFKVIDLTPQNAMRPSATRRLDAQLLTGVDPRGVLQTGVALDAAPYAWWTSNSLTLGDVRPPGPDDLDRTWLTGPQRWLRRVATRFRLSGAAAKAADDNDQAIRLSVAAEAIPFNAGDPHLDRVLSGCLITAEDPVNVETVEGETPTMAGLRRKIRRLDVEMSSFENLGAPSGILRVVEEQLIQSREEYKQLCLERGVWRNWNRSAWSLGLGTSWISANGRTGSLEWNSPSGWSTVAYGFEHIPPLGPLNLKRDFQLLVGASYTQGGENVRLPSDATDDRLRVENTLIVSNQLRYALRRKPKMEAPNLVMSFEGDYIYKNRRLGPPNESFYRLSFAADYELFSATHMKLTIGGSGGGATGRDQGFIVATLRHGF
jgi:hypothetical protein